MHYPVMLGESLEYLDVQPDGHYIDCTCGLGNHSRAIARRLTAGGTVWSCDRDAESLEKARSAGEADSPIRYVHTAFSGLEAALRALGAPPARGLLADLGVSRYQLTEAERGFSLQSDGPVDMRMDRSRGETAGDLVNFSAENTLADLIYQYGEERRARRIAKAIVRARPIRSTRHLAETIESAVPRTSRLHPATQTFMALRQVVNDEPGELEALLEAAPRLTAPGGRIVFLTFMSLEDRVVKRSFQRWQREGLGRILTKHVVPPSEAEVSENAASRSAKLRAFERLGPAETGL